MSEVSVMTITDVCIEDLSFQAWICMLISIVSYWGCGQVVHNYFVVEVL